MGLGSYSSVFTISNNSLVDAGSCLSQDNIQDYDHKRDLMEYTPQQDIELAV